MTREQLVSGIVITAITSLVAWLTSRSASKASVTNASTSSRVEMEKEAYERARKMDTETIDRQDKELVELESKYKKLKERLEATEKKNQELNDEVARAMRDNYQLHRENNRIVELNEQMISENRRIRAQGERVIQDNHRLSSDVSRLRDRVTRMQRGIRPNSDAPIRQRKNDTDPMLPEVDIGGE